MNLQESMTILRQIREDNSDKLSDKDYNNLSLILKCMQKELAQKSANKVYCDQYARSVGMR